MRFDPAYLQQFEAKMFIEGPQTALNHPVVVNLRTIPTQSEASSRNGLCTRNRFEKRKGDIAYVSAVSQEQNDPPGVAWMLNDAHK